MAGEIAAVDGRYVMRRQRLQSPRFVPVVEVTSITLQTLHGLIVQVHMGERRSSAGDRIEIDGKTVVLQQANLNPFDYAAITGAEPLILLACLSALAGAALALGTEWIAAKMK